MRLAKYVKFREEKFGGVLFETRSEKVFTLNATATAVVREIAGRARRTGDRRAAQGPLRRSGRRASSAKCCAFIADLRQRGLVEDGARG